MPSSPQPQEPRFRELPAPVALEEEVARFWREGRIFERSLEESQGRPEWVFYEGPPTANGTPHNGSVLTRVIKDLFPRYKTLRGFHVDRKAGWDTHGLPVEIEVEKELGMRDPGSHQNARDAVLDYGLDNFARKCVDSVFKYTHEWERMTERIGFWVDLDEAYVTYHRSYVESVWWALSQLFSKDLLYQGLKVVWWWPEGGTALSAGEVGEGYKDVDDPSVTVRFRALDEDGEDGHGVSYLAWTTTPWTLPSNVALAVGPDLDYVYVKREDGEVVVTAAALAPEGEVLRTVKGSELVGKRYEPLYDYRSDKGVFYEVVAGEHVTLSAGTGIVHTAPGYGEEDFELGKQAGLGVLQLVGPKGTFVEGGPEFVRGLHFKKADRPIMRDLTTRGLMFAAAQVRHSYPFSPRSDNDPLIQLARPGWFIRTTSFKDSALANNAEVNWLPEHIQDGRFGDFLRNNVDWALSRERFWGTPLPIWVCEGCQQMEAFESVEALQARGAEGFTEGLDEHLQVHKPWIDEVTVGCAACAGTMRRVPEVIDCWFDSGCMPFAQWGFPHQGIDRFRKAFPADFISEAVDQTRGWFYSLLMISTLLFDEETCRRYGLGDVGYPRPYKTCVVLGHVTDRNGRKESKSRGNYTPPDLVFRGRVRMRVLADETLKPGVVGMTKVQVKGLDLGKGEKMRLAATEDGADALAVELKGGPNRGKETVGVHPDTIAELGLTDHCWLIAPFQPPGADAFRWLFYASNPPWTSTRLSIRAIRDGQREFQLRLANVFQFFSIYANINGFDPQTTARVQSDSVLDRWIAARSADLVQTMTTWLDDYRIYEAARALSDFVDGLSNWFVRRSRSRFWGEGTDTTAALWTLYDALSLVTRLSAPFVPFMSEAMHQRLGLAGDSVHLGSWPEAPDTADPGLLDDMSLIRELASLGLAARAKVGVRVRQPLRAVEVILADPERAAGLGPLVELLRDELNVREVRFSQEAETFVDFKVKPNYPRLGKRLGREMKLCAKALAQADAAAVRAASLGDGFSLELPSGTLVLTEEDVVVEVRPKEGFQASGSASAVVALHAELDQDLREEGLSRELINRIQGRRKELDLGYTDRINLVLSGGPEILAAATRFHQHIGKETLAVGFELVALEEGSEDGVSIEVDGHALTLHVAPV